MFARTERLLLRPGWTEDAPALARAIGEEAIVRNLATAPWPYGLADAETFLASPRAQHDVSLLVLRRTLRAPQLIGAAGIKRGADGTFELGYWISRPHWGLGYATEAVGAIVTLARDALRLKVLHAEHFIDNPASGRVLEKAGFRPTGRIAHRPSLARGTSAPAKGYTLRLDEDEDGGQVDCVSERAMIAA